MVQWAKRSDDMKKTTLALFGIIAVLVVLFVIIMLLAPSPEIQTELPSQPVHTTPTTEPPTEEPEPPKPPANTY